MIPPELITVAGSLVGGTLINQLNKHNAIKMQDRINEYNLPINQKRRVEAAGFNPATFYNQQSVENTSAPAQIPDASSGFGSASGTMAAALAARNLLAQNDNLKEQNRVLKAQAKSQELDNQLKEAELPNMIDSASVLQNMQVRVDENGDISYGSWMYDEDGGQTYYPMFDKNGKSVPGFSQEMTYNYYRAYRDAIREGFNVDKDYFESKLAEIERDLKDEFGAKTANATINQLKALANQSNENARTLRLDNDAIESIGIGKTGMNILGNHSAKVLEVVLKSLLRSKK